MTPVSALAIEVIYDAKPALAALFAPELNAAMERYDIVTSERQAAFLAQVGVESQRLTHLVENLNYSTPERVVAMFRKFDLDNDRVVDPEEIEFAKTFLHQPTKLGNFAYANRFGNGDEASGDGYRYRARGLIGVTFRANVAACSTSLFNDAAVLLKDPDQLTEPRHAAMSAGWYWWSRGCNELADDGEFRQITKKINGGYNGYNERCELWKTAKAVLV